VLFFSRRTISDFRYHALESFPAFLLSGSLGCAVLGLRGFVSSPPWVRPPHVRGFVLTSAWIYFLLSATFLLASSPVNFLFPSSVPLCGLPASEVAGFICVIFFVFVLIGCWGSVAVVVFVKCGCDVVGGV
jgi:hypothetical protein